MKITIPNFVKVDLDDNFFLSQTRAVCIVEVSRSRGYYKKIRVETCWPKDQTARYLHDHLGIGNWWKRWRPKKTFFGRLFHTWERI